MAAKKKQNNKIVFDDINFDEIFNTKAKVNVLENQLLLPDGKLITFNPEQYEAIIKIRQWLLSNDKFFILSGFAGSGKTTCIKKILDTYRGMVVVSTPTHKAVKVISKITKKEGKTLHSLLGLRPDVELDEFNPNDPQFGQIGLPIINDYNLVIIDEASMINKDLFELIEKSIKRSRTKVIFIGDVAQIPPVNEEESFVFNIDTVNKYHLTIIERQSDSNPILSVYDDIRNNLLSYDGHYKRKTLLNEKGDGIVFTSDVQEFRNLLFDKIKNSEFKQNMDFVKLLAWRNKSVMNSNMIIRNELFGFDVDIVEVGDILMGYRSISDKSQRYNIIQNSNDYKIVNKSSKIKNDYGLYGFDVNIMDIDINGKPNYQDVFIIDCNDYDNIHSYAEFHDNLRDQGKLDKKKWKNYYEFRRNNIILKTIETYRDGTLRKKPDVIKKDMDYGYAVTVHKSQGSTYKHVFILENDIELNQTIKERNQIKYVAFTRPSNTAVVLTKKTNS